MNNYLKIRKNTGKIISTVRSTAQKLNLFSHSLGTLLARKRCLGVPTPKLQTNAMAELSNRANEIPGISNQQDQPNAAVERFQSFLENLLEV
jgi:hypothetical protein